MGLSERKITTWTKPISSLADRPQMSAAELKAAFDSNANEIKPKFNGLVDDLTGAGGASEIGASLEGVVGTNVQALLAALKALIDLRETTASTDEKLSEKADQTTVNKTFKDISVNESTGVVTLTYVDGTTKAVNTSLSKIAVNFGFDAETQKITLLLNDGTMQYIDVSAFIKANEIVDSDNIVVTRNADGTVSLSVKSGSINADMLTSTILDELKAYRDAAASSAQNAAASESNAQTYKNAAAKSVTDAQILVSEAESHETLSKSYAKGGTGTRSAEDTDNAFYYKELAKGHSETASRFVTQASEQAARAEAAVDKAGTVTITETQTLEAGQDAAITETPDSTPQARKLIVKIPRGEAGSIELTAQTLPAGRDATVTEMPDSTPGVRKYLLGIPQGDPASADEVVPAVESYLDAHPELTTTVEDGSITSQKLAGITKPYLPGFNYYNPDTVTYGIYLSDGVETDYGGSKTSDYIDVEDNLYVNSVVGYSKYRGIACYDATKTYISTLAAASESIQALPEGTKYLRVYSNTDVTPSILLTKTEKWRNSKVMTNLDVYRGGPKVGPESISGSIPDVLATSSFVKPENIVGANAVERNLIDPTLINVEQDLPISSVYYIANFNDTYISGNVTIYGVGNNGFVYIIAGSVTVSSGYVYTVNINEDVIDSEYDGLMRVYAVVSESTDKTMISTVYPEKYYLKGVYQFDPDENLKSMVRAAAFNSPKAYNGGVMLTLGDSYTAYMKGKFTDFALKHGLVQDNRGVGSSTIAGSVDGSVGFKPFWYRLDAAISEYQADGGYKIDGIAYTVDDVKLVTLMGGANDWSTVRDGINRLGVGPNDTNKETLYGALNYIFSIMLSTFKNADIVCILQPVNYNSGVPSTENDAIGLGFDSLEQAQGMTAAQCSSYVMMRKETIVREMAERYGIPICDCCFEWYNPMNPMDASTYWASDKLHLTAAGYQAIIDKLETVVDNLPFTRN